MRKRSSNEEDEDRDDVNVRAFEIVKQATSEDPPQPHDALARLIRIIRESDEDADALAERLWPDLRDLVAAELGRSGGRKGGAARKKNLSPERRREIARKAARARWGKE